MNDKKDFGLVLDAVQMEDSAETLTIDTLIEWYQRHGFKMMDGAGSTLFYF
jgi:hypothetical protein